MESQYRNRFTSGPRAQACACALLLACIILSAGTLRGQSAKRSPGKGGGNLSAYKLGDFEGAKTPLPERAVLTYHNDNARTGAYLEETQLTSPLVGRYKMRRRQTIAVGDYIPTQLLYVPGLMIGDAAHDVIYAAVAGNAVHAYDANDGTQLWIRRFTDPEVNTRTLVNGIAGTPVIDLSANILYVVFSTRNRNPVGGEICERPGMDVAFWLAAVDIRTGAVLRSVKVTGAVRRDDGTPLVFLERNHANRPALLLSQGSIYIAFGMRPQEECHEYHGWVMRYDAATFAPKGIFCTTPNVRGMINPPDRSGGGAGIWQGAAGLVDDKDGNVYFITGNGKLMFDKQGYGDSIVKLKPNGDTLEYAASFPPDDPAYTAPWEILQRNDVDLGSGGMMLIPGTDELIGGGKTGIWYLLDRFTMLSTQEFPAFTNQFDPSLRDQGWDVGPRLHGTPTYWRGPHQDFAYVYQWAEKDYLKAYKYSLNTGQFDADHPVVNTNICPNKGGGAMLSLSAKGTAKGTGIIWAMIPSADAVFRDKCDEEELNRPPNRLAAFDAETLKLLWQTNLPGRSHQMPPTIADGKVFVPASSQILVYELDKAPELQSLKKR